ncbi:MAG: hypothetical protein ACXABY_22045 [Candidatus Thorarchaeota archaeon]|jgi:hypothetical protein
MTEQSAEAIAAGIADDYETSRKQLGTPSKVVVEGIALLALRPLVERCATAEKHYKQQHDATYAGFKERNEKIASLEKRLRRAEEENRIVVFNQGELSAATLKQVQQLQERLARYDTALDAIEKLNEHHITVCKEITKQIREARDGN